MKSGIYKIENKTNGKMYIGSSVNIKYRFKKHKEGLKSNKHYNKHLQHSWNKYGKDAFVFSVVEYVEDVNNLIAREQFWIDKYDFDMLYNICPTAGSSLGYKHSEEIKKELSKARKGKKLSEETKKKLSKSRSGENNHNYGKTGINNPLSRLITFNDKTLSTREWADRLNISISALNSRFSLGWPIKKILTTPKRTPIKIEFNGKTQSRTEWANELNISTDTLTYRLKNGPLKKH